MYLAHLSDEDIDVIASNKSEATKTKKVSNLNVYCVMLCFQEVYFFGEAGGKGGDGGGNFTPVPPLDEADPLQTA